MINTVNKFIKTIKEDTLSSFIQELQFDISGFGRFYQQKANVLNNFFINDYELIYYIRGTSKITVAEQDNTVTPGQIVLLKPYTLYSAESIGEDPVCYYYIHFKVIPTEIHAIFYDLLASENELVYLEQEKFSDISMLFAQILNGWRNDSAGTYTLIYSCLKILITFLLQNKGHISTPIEHGVSVNQNVDIFFDAIKYISDNLDENIKLSTIAKELGISTSSLYKVFVNNLNLSPSEYIQKLRLFTAKQMLSISGTKIDDVVERCGFSSVSHLSRNFTDEYGFTPSQFQKYVREKEVWSDHDEKAPTLE